MVTEGQFRQGGYELQHACAIMGCHNSASIKISYNGVCTCTCMIHQADVHERFDTANNCEDLSSVEFIDDD